MKLPILAWRVRAEPLPLLHRCAILYLTMPVLIWLLGWFEWWFGVPAALLVGLALAPALRGGWRPRRPSPAALGIVAIGIACTMLTAHGGLFDGNNWDWWDRRALLLDLSRHPWPVRVRDGLADYLPWGGGEREALLRYYLAWYMVPGLAGRLFGPGALNWAVPLWSSAGLGLALLLFARGFGGGRAILAAVVFVLFGGMDAARSLLMYGFESFRFDIDVARWGWPGVEFHYGPWIGLPGRRTIYTGHFQSFAWSTDIIAAALYTLLIVRLRRHPRFLVAGGVVLAAAPFWSPFVALGLLPLVAVLLWENVARRPVPPAPLYLSGTSPPPPALLASWSNLCLAVPLAGLVAAYLSSGALDFDHGWLWEGLTQWRDFGSWAWKFYLSEFLVLLLFLLLLRPRLVRDPLFWAMLATLLLLPLYRLVDGTFTVRGALPALVLLSWFCARALLAAEAGVGGRVGRTLRRLGGAGVVCCLGVGALGPLRHLATATRNDVPFRYALSGFTTLTAAGQPRENLAAEVPLPLAAILRASSRDGHAARAPQQKASVVQAPTAGERVFRADFDIHVGERSLVLVNERCGDDDRLLRVRFPNPHTNARVEWNARPRWYGAGCGAVVGFPGWRVRSARVGQTPPDGGNWAVEVLFDESGRAVGASQPPYPAPGENPGTCTFHYGQLDRGCPAYPGIAVLREAYERARAGEPAARSRFDVYLDDEWITHVREPCVLGDMDARFYLHLVPADPADLPPPRRRSGFDNSDFTFVERGAMFDGKCVAVSRLPYPVREVRTGQFAAAGGVWTVTVRSSPAAPEP